MDSAKIKQKVSRFLEVLFTFLLLGTQTVLNAGVAISIMTIPLLPYIINFLDGHWPLNALVDEFWAIFLLNSFIVGRIILLIGLAILLVAAAQWLWNHHKKVGLYKTGIYGKIRHPQFTGIIITTMGLTVMSSTMGAHGSRRIVGLWLLQVLGYIVIAYYEERTLTKKFSEEYKEYKRKVPFLFPIKNPKKIPELIFTLIIVIIICVILWLLPYDLIRVFSNTLYETPWF